MRRPQGEAPPPPCSGPVPCCCARTAAPLTEPPPAGLTVPFDTLMHHLVTELAETRDAAAAAALARDGFVFAVLDQTRLCIAEVLSLRLVHFSVHSPDELHALCAKLRHGQCLVVRPDPYPNGFRMLRIGGPTCPFEWLQLLVHHRPAPHAGSRGLDRVVQTAAAAAPAVQEISRNLQHYVQRCTL